MLGLSTWLTACFSGVETRFASDAPVKKIVADTENPLPQNYFYRSTPIENVIISSETEFLKSKITAYDKSNGKQLWQTNFEAFYVGQTEKNILVYDLQNVIWLNPNNGEITRKIAKIPNPIKTSFNFNSYLLNGMAFNDEIYITTKPLYQQIYDANQKQDDSYQIGVTANNWEKNDKLWFVPPVKQIVNIEYKPVIFGDKVLIVNPPQSIDGKQTYQIISLKTGEEIYRRNTDGKYFLLGENILIEETSDKISRINFVENKPIWSISAAQIIGTHISAIGNQITIAIPDKNGTRNIKIIDAESGKELKKFDLPDLQETVFDGAFLLKNGSIALHFLKNMTTDKNYDYFVGWDIDAKKALWRTEFDGKKLTSLFNVIGEKMKVED
jgi:outer membrane protein assembly factor BamB